MIRRLLPILAFIGLWVLMVLRSLGLSEDIGRQERRLAEQILRLQAQHFASFIDAAQPEYTPDLQRRVTSEGTGLSVLLYDLAGRDRGRADGTAPLLQLNPIPPGLTPPNFLQPRHQETPLPPLTDPAKAALGEQPPENRLFTSNVLEGTWVSTLPNRAGEIWLVATQPITGVEARDGRAFISAWIQVARPLTEILRPGGERRGRIWTFWISVAVFAAGAFIWSSQQRHPVSSAATVAESLPLDRLATTRLPETIEDPEARRLVQACNRILDRVAEVHVAQQRFVADAAHELRTPLTILRGEIQVALREPTNQAFLVETLRSSLDETVHLSRLVDSLLTLARADAGQALASRVAVDLVPLIEQTLGKLETLATARRVRLVFKVTPNTHHATVSGDPVALERVVMNLVDNAIKHSPQEHAVTVTLTRTNDRVSLAVEDRGIGIALEHQSKIFDRFYRVDAARRRADGGIGLGLSIVRTLVLAHGGEVGVRSEIGEGATFNVTLPVSESSPSGSAGARPGT